jgi:septum formation protein
MANPQIYLASNSPRRRELLAQIGVRFGVIAVDLREEPLPAEVPEEYVVRIALDKARAGGRLVARGPGAAEGAFRPGSPAGSRKRRSNVSTDFWQPALPVLAADTVVVVDGRILGKPSDRAAAAAMMRLLSGRTHRVLSGVALIGEAERFALSVSEVSFRRVSAEEARAYWETGEPDDKAGGYGIQGLGALFVRDLRGSYSGVMGLPLYETSRLLAAEGIDALAGGRVRRG